MGCGERAARLSAWRRGLAAWLALLGCTPQAFAQPIPGEFLERVVVLTNQERARRNLPPLKPNPLLQEAAQRHAEDMVRQAYFSHRDRKGRSPLDRILAAGYEGNVFGENIAEGHQTPEEVVRAWMESKGHRENVLSGDYREIGVGCAGRQMGRGALSPVWVQTFGAREDYFPIVAALGAGSVASSVVDLYLYGEGWARRMRLRTDGGSFTPWQPFRSRVSHPLPPGSGLRTVAVELERERGEVRSDTVQVRVREEPERPADASTKPEPPSRETGADATPPRGASPSRGVLRRDAAGMPLVPMVFPLLAKVQFEDTFGAPRAGGARKHLGQDLMAPKMTPLLAAFDGIVYLSRGAAPNAHNMLKLVGDNGWTAVYLHINNDRPGTDDGQGSEEYAFPAGLQSGDRVVAGQLVAWCGDSGNAEDVGSHLHFELWSEAGPENAYAALKQAEVLMAPRLNLPELQMTAQGGETRLDGVVRALDSAAAVAELDLISHVPPGEPPASILKPTRVRVKLGGAQIARTDEGSAAIASPEIAVGDRVAVFTRDQPGAGEVVARAVAIMPAPAAGVAVTANPPNRRGGASDEGTGGETGQAAPAEASAGSRAHASAVPAGRIARLLEAVNQARREAGRTELTLNSRLSAAAQKHARDMGLHRVFQHEGTDGSSAEDRVRREGYAFSIMVQNMARGITEPEAVVAAWMARSREARMNLLDPGLTEAGIGTFVWTDAEGSAKARMYWVLVLAAPAAP